MGNHIKQADKIYLLTSGQILCFNKDGDQIAELQAEFSHGGAINRELLKKIAENCTEHFISKWCEWNQLLSKNQFITLFC